MKACDGCKFCCWAFGIVELEKEPLLHCNHECAKGCSIYQKDAEYPKTCGEFMCPYLTEEWFHRPDTFQPLLEGLGGNLGSYIPTIPQVVPVEEAKELIIVTRTILAAIENVGDNGIQWIYTVIPLRRNPDGRWVTGSTLYKPWQDLCQKHETMFPGQMLMPWFTVVEK